MPSNPFPLTSYLIENTASSWKAYVQHDFVRLLGQGTLDRKLFVHFIKYVPHESSNCTSSELTRQDYYYLKYYSRAYGYAHFQRYSYINPPASLLAAKYTDFTSISDSAQAVIGIINEIGNHRNLCRQFGVTMEELESTIESRATTAYGAYILDMGLQGR